PMGTWSFVSLTVVGDKKDVSAFDRAAPQLPVLSHYVTERAGKPITYAMFEDMVVEKPRRWRKQWWYSSYLFATKDPDPAVEMVQDVSTQHPNLCFQLDWNCEREEFRTHFIRRGRVEYQDFDAMDRRDELFTQLSGSCEKTEDELHDEGIDWQIDDIITDEFTALFAKLWHARIYRI